MVPTGDERAQIARIVAALSRPGTAAELSDEESYLRAFDETFPLATQPTRTIVLGARAAVAASIALVVSAAGAAAYTGSLPGPLQRAAHSVIGAPADDQGSGEATDDPTDEPTGTPSDSPSDTATGTPTGSSTSAHGVGPDATGPAAFGLCTAWSKGGLSTTSVAYRNLAAAAGGPDGIAAYCTPVLSAHAQKAHGSSTHVTKPKKPKKAKKAKQAKNARIHR